MSFPTTIHHYYERSKGPYRSLSELADTEFKDLMEELGSVDTVENRFDETWKRDFYQPFRLYVEENIRNSFQDKGGKPTDAYPRYFTLGPASWFHNWYLDTQEEVVSLSNVPEDQISFTFPDSMMSFLIAEDRFEPFAKFKQPYHGQVFTLREIRELVLKLGFPDESDPRNLEYGNRIIEAQVWDLELLMSLRTRNA